MASRPGQGKKFRMLLLYTGLVFLVAGWPETARALQVHGAPEGLYIHQLAHIHFLAALGYLFWDIQRTTFAGGRGWRYLQLFCVLMICWNIVAFTGHIAGGSLVPEDFMRTDGYLQSTLLGPLAGVKLLYYATKLDHLVCVPALFFLFLGMRSLYKAVDSSKGGED